jgi:Domain of unknown function (DUF4249)
MHLTFAAMKREWLFLLWILPVLLIMLGCEKEITVSLPTAPPQIVVEGSIENGQQPLVMLTWSQGYFDPADLSTLEGLFVRGATVRIWDGTDTTELQQICTDQLTPQQQELAAQVLGYSVETLVNLNICVYTSFSLVGQVNKVYKLLIDYEGKHLEGSTKIDRLVRLDSVWFNIVSTLPNDSLGFMYAYLTDPDTLGNAYRWYAKRINHYPEWVPDAELRGQPKDGGFIAPLGSVFDDAFFNGLHFEFGYYRGSAPNSAKYDDQNREAGFFKRGDTVVVRGCVIDRGVFNFLRSFENQVNSQGSPFAIPANIPSNISGGLGVWAGYGAVYDTVICR